RPAAGERLQEVRDVARLRLQGGHPALLKEAPELEQVRAVRVERVAREAPLELEVGEEVEYEVLEPALDYWLLDCRHAPVFGRARLIPCGCTGNPAATEGR